MLDVTSELCNNLVEMNLGSYNNISVDEKENIGKKYSFDNMI